MEKANQALRDKARTSSVRLWECAEFLGISEPTIIRWLRVPLSPEREKQITNAIDTIAAERQAAQ